MEKLYRNKTNHMIAGVCSGLSDYFNLDVSIIRILFAALFIFSFGFTFWLYIVMWIIVPEKFKKNYGI